VRAMLFWSYVENLLYRPLKGVFYKGAEQNPRASIISSAEHFSIHAIEVFDLCWSTCEFLKFINWIAFFFLFAPEGRWATCWFR